MKSRRPPAPPRYPHPLSHEMSHDQGLSDLMRSRLPPHPSLALLHPPAPPPSAPAQCNPKGVGWKDLRSKGVQPHPPPMPLGFLHVLPAQPCLVNLRMLLKSWGGCGSRLGAHMCFEPSPTFYPPHSRALNKYNIHCLTAPALDYRFGRFRAVPCLTGARSGVVRVPPGGAQQTAGGGSRCLACPV
jgi:hypothetical protein